MILQWGCISLILSAVHVNAYYENAFTADIPPGKQECYFQTIKEGMVFEIEYQVVAGGDLDIDFQIIGPKGQALTIQNRKTDGSYKVSPTINGDYEICFDNTFSGFTKKNVYFEMIIDNESEDYNPEEKPWKDLQLSQIESELASIELAEDNVRQIKMNNAKSLQLQNLLRAFEAKDRSVAERNFTRIGFWSVINIVVMLGVVALQVFMVRNMFYDNRKVRT